MTGLIYVQFGNRTRRYGRPYQEREDAGERGRGSEQRDAHRYRRALVSASTGDIGFREYNPTFPSALAALLCLSTEVSASVVISGPLANPQTYLEG